MNKKTIIWLLTLIFIVGLSTNVGAAHQEMPPGRYFTLVDENNNIIHQTSMQVFIGDEYIGQDNSHYKVIEVIGDTAKCIYQGIEKMPEITFNTDTQAWVFHDDVLPVVNGNKTTVAVYCTHSDESYVPGDGASSIEGRGGIYDVAQSFVNRVKTEGLNVEYSDNNHNPHDINAYNRSRKTAVSLLKSDPSAIFDVHRDAVPPQQYTTTVNGKDATKIKLVVGRTNPNFKTNLEFAKRIKAIMDKEKPGLSNGIFIGKGDYNQDLSPRAMLIEVGTHRNDKQAAIEGAKQFADIIPTVLGVSGEKEAAEAAKKPLQDNQGAGTTIIVILLVLAAVAGGFYLLNKGPADKNG